jgi:hypothetical protein
VSNHAIRKKLAKKFKVGDIVTWGYRRVAHRIIEVCRDGVYVDSTSSNCGELMRDGRRRLLVPYIARRRRGVDGPPEHTTLPPDVL